jgi:hypothetical protein
MTVTTNAQGRAYVLVKSGNSAGTIRVLASVVEHPTALSVKPEASLEIEVHPSLKGLDGTAPKPPTLEGPAFLPIEGQIREAGATMTRVRIGLDQGKVTGVSRVAVVAGIAEVPGAGKVTEAKLSDVADMTSVAEEPGRWEKVWQPAGTVTVRTTPDAVGTIYGGDGRALPREEAFCTRRDTGDIHRMVGPGRWERIGGPAKKFVTDGVRLYGLSPDGSGVYGHDSAGKWTRVGNAAGDIYAGHAGLFATNPENGDLYQYGGKPFSWTRVGGPAKTVAVGSRGHLYGLSPDGSGIYQYSGTPGTWRRIGGAATALYAGGDKLYATGPSGDIDEYSGTPMSWTRVGGPGRSFTVDCRGALYGLSPDGSAVYRYMGRPGEWEKVGGPAASISAGVEHLYATRPQNHELWALRPGSIPGLSRQP